jgi:hypothetical protein
MDFEAVHHWLLLQPFFIVGMAAILLTVAYLIDRLMEWLTSDRFRGTRRDKNPHSIPGAPGASRSVG